MANMTVGAVYRVVTYCRKNPQNGLNISHWQVVSIALGDVTEVDAILSFSTQLAPLIKDCMTSLGRYLGASIQRIRPTVGSAVTTRAGAVDGTGGAAAMSTQTAGVIQLRTALAGKQNRGRKYIPFPAEDQNDVQGVPSALYLVALNGVGQWYATPQNVGPGADTALIKPVIYHPGTQTTTDVDRYTISENWGTQRRRSQINRPDAPPVL